MLYTQYEKIQTPCGFLAQLHRNCFSIFAVEMTGNRPVYWGCSGKSYGSSCLRHGVHIQTWAFLLYFERHTVSDFQWCIQMASLRYRDTVVWAPYTEKKLKNRNYIISTWVSLRKVRLLSHVRITWWSVETEEMCCHNKNTKLKLTVSHYGNVNGNGRFICRPSLRLFCSYSFPAVPLDERLIKRWDGMVVFGTTKVLKTRIWLNIASQIR